MGVPERDPFGPSPREKLLQQKLQEETDRNSELISQLTALKERNIRLESESRMDSLCNCGNRARLERDLYPSIEKTMARANAQIINDHERVEKDINYCLLFIDVDKFKEINDTRGHEIGDKVLQRIAKLFKDLTQGQDEVIRLGGDEFVIVVRSDVKGGISVAKRLLEAVQIINEELGVHIGFSIGIKEVLKTDANMAEVMKAADNAMYQAKKGGGQGYEVFKTISPAEKRVE